MPIETKICDCGCGRSRPMQSRGKYFENACRARDNRRKNSDTSEAANERDSLNIKLNAICGEYDLTLLEVVTAWGSRAAVINFYHQSESKFRIICAGVKELSK